MAGADLYPFRLLLIISEGLRFLIFVIVVIISPMGMWVSVLTCKNSVN